MSLDERELTHSMKRKPLLAIKEIRVSRPFPKGRARGAAGLDEPPADQTEKGVLQDAPIYVAHR